MHELMICCYNVPYLFANILAKLTFNTFKLYKLAFKLCSYSRGRYWVKFIIIYFKKLLFLIIFQLN